MALRPHIIFPLDTIPKGKSGKFRLISDCRYLNSFLNVPHFKHEDLRDLPNIAQPNDYMFSIDLTDGYFHVPLKPEHWTYLGFECCHSTYVCTCLPFGLSPAPAVFSKVMREIVGHLRSKGVRVLPYLDDFLFFAKTVQEAE